MSCRVDTSPLIASACVVSLYDGLGITGAAMRTATASGGSGAGVLYNDWDSGDDSKEFRALTVTPPASGVFTANEDGSFSLLNASDGSYTYVYRLFVDGVDQGVATASITVGTGQSLTPGVASLAITGYAPVITQAAGQSVNPGAASLTYTGYAPTVSQTLSGNVSPGAASLVVQGYAPTVTQAGQIGIVPDARRLVVTTSAFRPVPAPLLDVGLPTIRAGARLDFEFDWAGEVPGPWLANGETITASVVGSFGPVDVTLRGQQGGKVQVWASVRDDASPGMYCAAICSITTSLGRTDSRRFELVTQPK